MWGAVIGDLAGSIYEFDQIKKVNKVNNEEIIPENAFFSDDTILTIAVLDAILHDKNYEEYLKKYGKDFLNYKPNFKPYFKGIFSPGFEKWINSEGIQGTSIGNGAMMRVSPIGYMFDSEKEVIKNSKLATIPSHNSKEAILCAETISLIIFYARQGMKKEDILKKLDLENKLQYKPFEKFNYTCMQTIENCLYATFNSNSFEESINTVLSYGGDTDTNACIVGSMAEALYGIDNDLIKKAKEKIPAAFVKVLENGYKKMNKKEDIER